MATSGDRVGKAVLAHSIELPMVGSLSGELASLHHLYDMYEGKVYEVMIRAPVLYICPARPCAELAQSTLHRSALPINHPYLA